MINIGDNQGFLVILEGIKWEHSFTKEPLHYSPRIF